jgi:hypothetical protein
MVYLNKNISTLTMTSYMMGSKGGARCQQQREPSVDGYRTVPVGGIVLGKGVESEREQEYRDELFHCCGFLNVQRRERRKGGTQRKGAADLRVLLSLRSDS